MKTTLAQALSAAAVPYMGSVNEASELANNVAVWAHPTFTDLEAHIAMTIRHRLANSWATCGDVDSCAVAMARTVRRHGATVQASKGLVVVGRKGPAFGGPKFSIQTGANHGN